MIWLWNIEQIDIVLDKVAKIVGYHLDASELFLALSGLPSVEFAKTHVLTEPIRLHTDYLELMTTQCTELDADTRMALFEFLQSVPVDFVPIAKSNNDDVQDWVNHVVHYHRSLEPIDEPELNLVDTSKFDLEIYDYEPEFANEIGQEELIEWLFEAYEEETGQTVDGDNDSEAFNQWRQESQFAKELQAHVACLVKKFAKQYYENLRPMLHFIAFELSENDDVFSSLHRDGGKKTIIGMWRFTQVNHYFSSNFDASIDEICIYDTVAKLCVFVDGQWVQLAEASTYDLVIPKFTSAAILLDRCDAVTEAHLDFAKELIKYKPFASENIEEYDDTHYCASLVSDYSNDDLVATSLLLSMMFDYDELAVNVEPVYFDDDFEYIRVSDAHYDYGYRSENVRVFFTHVEGRRTKSNERTMEGIARAIYTVDTLRDSERRDMTLNELAYNLKQREFADMLSRSMPNDVKVHAFDPWQYPRS